jgi:uncharacterized RDD family membrane protein YckC
MATTSHESDFDWIKRQGKEFQGLRGLSSRAKDSLLAVAGGTAIVVGSLLPWVAFNDADVEIRPAAKTASVVLGLVVAALGFALRRAPEPGRRAAGIGIIAVAAGCGAAFVAAIMSFHHGQD